MLSKNQFLSHIPIEISKSIKRWNFYLVTFSIFQIFGSYLALLKIGADTEQGHIYRIIFIHVPVAWCAFFWIFLSAFFSLFTLIKVHKAEIFDRSSYTALELGTVFTLLTLVTGSLWGKPTWGVWWDWDPRLTSSLVMLLVCCGYLVLRSFTLNPKDKRNFCAMISLLNAVNVPIVYYSVNLWRSIHQPQTFMQKSQNVSFDIFFVLFLNYFTMFLLSIAIYKIRRQAVSAKETLNSARGDQI
jgi:heme exporter protein C